MSWITKQLLGQLSEIVGPTWVKTDANDLTHYGKDWSSNSNPDPSAITLPASIKEVQDIVALANEHCIPLVPSGGRTGLSGGAVAEKGELVVSFDRMKKILDFDATDRLVTCQPGVVTSDLKEFAEAKGLFYAVDFASAGASQLGGNVATNAGGINVLRYGMTRDYVKGMKVVTGKGELLNLNRGLTKNATGYDFRHLFIGSEGTLGFVVELTLELINPPKDPTVMLLGLERIENTTELLRVFKENLNLTAFEFFSGNAIRRVMEANALNDPLSRSYQLYVLLEFENSSKVELELATEVFERCVAHGYAKDGVISQSQDQARKLWKFREGITESIAKHTPFKSDVSVRESKIPHFLRRLEEILIESVPQLEAVLFGHLGDGNIHINLLKPFDMQMQEFREECEKVSNLIFELVQKLDGSISAEHGIGLVKKPYLKYSRDEADRNYMKGVKRIFDPKNIMNPGKLLDA